MKLLTEILPSARIRSILRGQIYKAETALAVFSDPIRMLDSAADFDTVGAVARFSAREWFEQLFLLRRRIELPYNVLPNLKVRLQRKCPRRPQPAARLHPGP